MLLWKHYTKTLHCNFWRVLQFCTKTCLHEEQLFYPCTDCGAHDLVCVLFIKIANIHCLHAAVKMHIWLLVWVFFSNVILYLCSMLGKVFYWTWVLQSETPGPTTSIPCDATKVPKNSLLQLPFYGISYLHKALWKQKHMNDWQVPTYYGVDGCMRQKENYHIQREDYNMFLGFSSSWDNAEVTHRVMTAQRKSDIQNRNKENTVLQAYIISLHKIMFLFVFLIHLTEVSFIISEIQVPRK